MYGNVSVRGGKSCAQIGLGCLYDALNHMILDVCCSKFNEMAFAEAQIAKVRESTDNLPFMVAMDWGYPSMPAFLRMIDDGIYFVIRLKSSDFKAEQLSLSSDDEDVDIRLTQSRRHYYIGTEDEALVISRDSLFLRMVRVWLDEDKTKSEILAGNLLEGQLEIAFVNFIICAGELKLHTKR